MIPHCEHPGCQVFTRSGRKFCKEHYVPQPRLRGGTTYRQHKSFKEAIKKRDNYTCQICGAPGRDVDHIIPYAISGETRPSGVRLLCHKCNCATRRPAKNARVPYDAWIAKLEAELQEQAG